MDLTRLANAARAARSGNYAELTALTHALGESPDIRTFLTTLLEDTALDSFTLFHGVNVLISAVSASSEATYRLHDTVVPLIQGGITIAGNSFSATSSGCDSLRMQYPQQIAKLASYIAVDLPSNQVSSLLAGLSSEEAIQCPFVVVFLKELVLRYTKSQHRVDADAIPETCVQSIFLVAQAAATQQAALISDNQNTGPRDQRTLTHAIYLLELLIVLIKWRYASTSASVASDDAVDEVEDSAGNFFLLRASPLASVRDGITSTLVQQLARLRRLPSDSGNYLEGSLKERANELLLVIASVSYVKVSRSIVYDLLLLITHIPSAPSSPANSEACTAHESMYFAAEALDHLVHANGPSFINATLTYYYDPLFDRAGRAEPTYIVQCLLDILFFFLITSIHSASSLLDSIVALLSNSMYSQRYLSSKIRSSGLYLSESLKHSSSSTDLVSQYNAAIQLIVSRFLVNVFARLKEIFSFITGALLRPTLESDAPLLCVLPAVSALAIPEDAYGFRQLYSTHFTAMHDRFSSLLALLRGLEQNLCFLFEFLSEQHREELLAYTNNNGNQLYSLYVAEISAASTALIAELETSNCAITQLDAYQSFISSYLIKGFLSELVLLQLRLADSCDSGPLGSLISSESSCMEYILALFSGITRRFTSPSPVQADYQSALECFGSLDLMLMLTVDRLKSITDEHCVDGFALPRLTLNDLDASESGSLTLGSIATRDCLDALISTNSRFFAVVASSLTVIRNLISLATSSPFLTTFVSQVFLFMAFPASGILSLVESLFNPAILASTDTCTIVQCLSSFLAALYSSETGPFSVVCLGSLDTISKFNVLTLRTSLVFLGSEQVESFYKTIVKASEGVFLSLAPLLLRALIAHISRTARQHSVDYDSSILSSLTPVLLSSPSHSPASAGHQSDLPRTLLTIVNDMTAYLCTTIPTCEVRYSVSPASIVTIRRIVLFMASLADTSVVSFFTSRGDLSFVADLAVRFVKLADIFLSAILLHSANLTIDTMDRSSLCTNFLRGAHVEERKMLSENLDVITESLNGIWETVASASQRSSWGFTEHSLLQSAMRLSGTSSTSSKPTIQRIHAALAENILIVIGGKLLSLLSDSNDAKDFMGQFFSLDKLSSLLTGVFSAITMDIESCGLENSGLGLTLIFMVPLLQIFIPPLISTIAISSEIQACDLLESSGKVLDAIMLDCLNKSPDTYLLSMQTAFKTLYAQNGLVSLVCDNTVELKVQTPHDFSRFLSSFYENFSLERLSVVEEALFGQLIYLILRSIHNSRTGSVNSITVYESGSLAQKFCTLNGALSEHTATDSVRMLAEKRVSLLFANLRAALPPTLSAQAEAVISPAETETRNCLSNPAILYSAEMVLVNMLKKLQDAASYCSVLL